MSPSKSTLLLAVLILFASSTLAAHDLEFEDLDLDVVMGGFASSTRQTTTTSKEATNVTTESFIKVWIVYLDKKHQEWNAQFQPCGAECQSLLLWIKEWRPEGAWQTGLDWAMYGLANPILVLGRVIVAIIGWFWTKVVLVRVYRILGWITQKCFGTKQQPTQACKKKTGKSVSFASPLVTENDTRAIKEHSLVRIFCTPEYGEKVGYIGVYMYTCRETGETRICQVPFVEKEHIELAKSRVYHQSTQIKCRPMQLNQGQPRNQIHLYDIKKNQPAQVWAGRDASGKKITIDKMNLSVSRCIYSSSNGGRDVPVIDIYGTIYPSMRAFLCNSDPLTLDDLKLLQPQSHTDGPQSRVIKAVACSENVCAVTPLDATKRPLDWAASHDPSEVKQRTARLQHILKAKERELRNSGFAEEQQSWNGLVDACSQYASLYAQIDPAESSSVFCWAKRFFGVMAFAAEFSLFGGGDKKSVSKAPNFDLEQLSKNTHITYGEPLEYEELLKVAKPGDMIAVHGIHAMSRIICKIQSNIKDGAEYLSHLMMVVDTSVFIMPGMVPGELYVIEACTGGGMIDDTYDVLPDVYGISKSGVQIRSLRGSLSESAKQDSLYLLCPLKESYRATFDAHVSVNRTHYDQPCKMVSNMGKYLNKRYTLTPANFFIGSSNTNIDGTNVGDTLRDILTGYALRNQSPIGSEYFCSELVGDLYIDMGILKPKKHIPHGANLSDHVTAEEIETDFFVGRQLFPLDFFLVHSKIPYLFDPLRVILPTQTVQK